MRVVFMGTPDFSVPVLTEIIGQGHEVCAVYSRAPQPAGRGMDLRPSPVHRTAEQFGIPVFTPKSLRNAEAQAGVVHVVDEGGDAQAPGAGQHPRQRRDHQPEIGDQLHRAVQRLDAGLAGGGDGVGDRPALRREDGLAVGGAPDRVDQRDVLGADVDDDHRQPRAAHAVAELAHQQRAHGVEGVEPREIEPDAGAAPGIGPDAFQYRGQRRRLGQRPGAARRQHQGAAVADRYQPVLFRVHGVPASPGRSGGLRKTDNRGRVNRLAFFFPFAAPR